MEGDNVETSGATSSFGATVSSRWNPTKEQITILENLYNQGVRTPSAEQIQQITGRLRDYGQIEGKNVFYWFQNHKARQRQKQKQESLAYFNRFVHRNPPPPPPVFAPTYPCPNVVCSPYYIHQNDVGFYPQYHNSGQAIQTGGTVRRPKNECNYDSEGYSGHGSEATGIDDECEDNKETLSLFPTHPTGDLQAGPPPTTADLGSADSSSFGHSGIEGSIYRQTYFDFFCRQGS